VPDYKVTNLKQKDIRMRGYCGVGLDNPKTDANIGAALRACGVYESAFMAVSGKRYKKSCVDTRAQYRHSPLFHVDDLKSIIPYDCIPVAVDLLDDAEPLHTYVHPERAFYIFGAEDATLGERITGWCRDKIYIPTNGCMNLAATVNVVLYDRLAKQLLKESS